MKNMYYLCTQKQLKIDIYGIHISSNGRDETRVYHSS